MKKNNGAKSMGKPLMDDRSALILEKAVDEIYQYGRTILLFCTDSRQNLQEIRGAAKRLLNFSKDLRACVGKSYGEPTTIDLNDFLLTTQGLLQRMVGQTIRIVLQLEKIPAKITGNSETLEKAIVNLMVNARDALPKGGIIVIKTEIHDGRWVCLTVEDNGVGISSEILPNIFEPFFTTSETNLGLGLAVVRGIVRQMGGFIDVKSEVGIGSKFFVHLPLIS